MAEAGNDQILMKVAVLGITFSVICTLGLAVLWNYGSDYSYDEITKGRTELIDFSGQSMINQNPWFLTHVYTPWVSSDGAEGHIDQDGWLFGQEITDYPDLNKATDIALDVDQKSSVPISISSEQVSWRKQTGLQWWADNPLSFITRPIGEFFGGDPFTYTDVVGSKYNFTGYRYVFDPSLPFKSGTSTVDGSLSIVWYSYNNQEGLSGGLQVYGGDVLLSSYSATDIVAGYNTTQAYATTYQFMFDGTPLTLSIRFNPEVIESGTPLLSAFVQGSWTMAISSVSAGNFYDLDNSASFATTTGGIINTFVQIYTFNTPNVENDWAQLIIWLLVGLPMTIAMLCVSMRIVGGVLKVF